MSPVIIFFLFAHDVTENRPKLTRYFTRYLLLNCVIFDVIFDIFCSAMIPGYQHGPYIRAVYTGAFFAPVYTGRIYGSYIRPVYTGSVYRPWTPSANKILQIQQFKMTAAAILKKSKNLNIFATDWPILTKFGMLMRLDPLHSNSQ